MDNFVITEKALKRWLKNRVKVTAATVVGFLIMGTAAFGVENGWIDVPEKGAYKVIVNEKQVETQYEWTATTPDSSTIKGNNVFYGESSGINGMVNVADNVATIAKNTNIVLESNVTSSSCTPNVISTTGTVTKAINNGNIWIGGEGNILAMGTAWDKKNIIENNGNIYVNGTNAIAMGIGPAGSGTNAGNIYVKEGIGIINYQASDKTEFTNKGNVIVTGEGTAIKSTGSNFTLNLRKGSHIEGLINLIGENATVDIDGVGTAENPETTYIEGEDTTVKITDSNIILEGKIKSDNSSEIVGGNEGSLGTIQLVSGNGTITNNAEIIGKIGVSTKEWGPYYNKSAAQKFENNGTINAEEFGIMSNAQIGTYIENIINNTSIKVTSDSVEGIHGIYAAGLAQGKANAKTYVENNGDIIVSGNKNAVGIRLHENIEGLNNKNITVSSENAIGVSLTGGANADILDDLKAEYATFKNNGKISTEGKNTIGLLLNHQAAMYINSSGAGTQDVVLSGENTENGEISVSGENAIGVKLYSQEIKGLDLKDVKVNFTNNGTIELVSGTTNGTGILVEAGTAINNGTIKLGMKNTGNIAINNAGGTAKNIGIVQISDMTKDEIIALGDKKEALEALFEGEVTHTGLITDKDGNALFLNEDTTVKEDTTTDVLDTLAKEDGSVGVDGSLTITGNGDNKVESEVFNVTNGTATIKGKVILDSDKINMDAAGKLAVTDESVLTLENGTLDKAISTTEKDKIAVEISKNGVLNIDNMTMNADVTGSGNINVTGNNVFNGNIKGTDSKNKLTINFGNMPKENLVATFEGKTNIHTISSSADWSNTITNIGEGHQLAINVDSNGANIFENSNGMQVTGTNNTDVMFKTGNLSGNKITLNLGDNEFENVGAVTDSEIYSTSGITDNDSGITDTIVLEYNTNLYEDNAVLNKINSAAVDVSNYFSADVDGVRKTQLDTIYAENIYSETVRAAYDGIKMSEDAVLSMAHNTKAGEFKVDGKALFSKDEYTKDGTIGSYDASVETTGLLASFEYGLSDNTTVGAVFSGAKQDIDTFGGSADADLFYLGAFANKTVGNYDLTAGLGYQLGKYESDNNAADISSSDKYDSNAFSAYVQGKYNVKLDDTLKFVPRLGLGYTYIDQDNAEDSYFGVSDAEISTFDAELGFDIVKSVQFEKSNLDVTFGTSYIKTMGDTDKKFEGSFASKTGRNEFDVLGAELAENVIRFNIGAEVTNENGFFYNGGFTYEFGSNDTEAYGVNAGVGYKF